jgi:ATP-binding cassette subfamily B protein
MTASSYLFEARYRQKVELRFNEMLMQKMYSLNQEQFEDEEFNTRLGRATDGLNSMQRTMDQLSWLISSTVRFVGAMTAIIIVSPLVGVAIVVLTIPSSLVRFKQNRIQEKVYKDVEPLERITYRTRWLLVDPQTMPEIRLINGFGNLLEHWKKNKKSMDTQYFDLEKRSARLKLLSDLSEPLLYFGSLLYFFRLLASGSLGLEQFLFMRGLLEQAINSAGSVAGSFEQLDEMFINVGNFAEIMDAKPAIPNGFIKVSRPLTIEFKDVSFTYPSSKMQILHDVSFMIVPGSKLALVGENGAGKSTLLKLLLRQYLPTSGNITVNGIDIADVEMKSYYAALSNLSQDFLIASHLTIEDNISFGLDKVADSDIKKSLELSGAWDFVEKLPNKTKQRLDTSFKDGTNLSGGQLQRIGVARALLRGGDVMILDEPTSAIDAKAEFEIFNNIYKEHAGRTTIIVSHRFSTVRKADAIIVMEVGTITEYGSHEELLNHKGLYKEMFEIQAEGYK